MAFISRRFRQIDFPGPFRSPLFAGLIMRARHYFRTANNVARRAH